LKKDKDCLIATTPQSKALSDCEQDGMNLRRWGDFRNDKNVVLNAVIQNGMALEYASTSLKADPGIVIAACDSNGNALQFASSGLRSTKMIVCIAAKRTPASLKYAEGGLNQDRDCLIAATHWDKNSANSATNSENTSKKIILSTRFALGETSSSIATEFTVSLKRHTYIKNEKFSVYSPNAYDKKTCDPQGTRLGWPCRGTFETCKMVPNSLKVGVPTSEACWRYSFRFQLEEAKRSNGFMIQVVEYDFDKGDFEIGKGQQIETEMANQVGTKIFRFYDYRRDCEVGVHLKDLIEDIQVWYAGNCKNMTEIEIYEDDLKYRIPQQIGDFYCFRPLSGCAILLAWFYLFFYLCRLLDLY